jgi:NAD(P)-dependent dehydrogenase (short-subunit alcohol dehydrogenase family)
MPGSALDFTGRKVVVIGGTSGTGLDVARRVLQAGGSAVVTGRTRSGADRAVADLAACGKAFGLAADLTFTQAVNQLRLNLTDQHADATLLVNAACVFAPKSFLDHTPEDYDRYHAINRALFFLTQTVVGNMINRGAQGAIVNIGETCAHQAAADTPSSAYAMAKAGLHSLTQHLAVELAPHGIRVNAVAPEDVAGAVDFLLTGDAFAARG